MHFHWFQVGLIHLQTLQIELRHFQGLQVESIHFQRLQVKLTHFQRLRDKVIYFQRFQASINSHPSGIKSDDTDLVLTAQKGLVVDRHNKTWDMDVEYRPNSRVVIAISHEHMII